MNNNVLRILFAITLVCSCTEKTTSSRSKEQQSSADTSKSTNIVDTLSKGYDRTESENTDETNGKLQKYFYPNMSFCAGALYGFYKDKELVRIESTYGAELGFSSRNIDFINGKVVRIKYREHFAEWEKYRQRYPSDDEFEEKHMTYSDTTYIIEFGKTNSFKQYAGKKLVSTEVRQELLDRLLSCVETMKGELAREKQLVKGQ